MNFRKAKIGDANSIANVHIRSWVETYSNLLPKELIATQNLADRVSLWTAVLESAEIDTSVYIAKDAENTVGFISFGAQRDESLLEREFSGEITAFYVLKDYQRSGVGSQLFEISKECLCKEHNAFSLWVLKQNKPALSFYLKKSGAIIGAEAIEEKGFLVEEVAIGWRCVS